MPMRVREMLQLLRKNGWEVVRFDGTSHRQLEHPDRDYTITVAGAEHIELSRGMERAILKQAGLK